LVADRLLEILQGRPGLQPQRDLGSGFRQERIPAFGFATGLTGPSRLLIVRMYLHGQFVTGKQKLREQRESIVAVRGCPHKITAVLLRQLAQRAPRQRPIGYAIVFPSEPALADALGNHPGVDWPKITDAPRAFVKDGDQQEWVEFGHEVELHAGKEPAHPLQSAL